MRQPLGRGCTCGSWGLWEKAVWPWSGTFPGGQAAVLADSASPVVGPHIWPPAQAGVWLS